MTWRQQLVLTAQLSAPAILAQLSSIVMQYIDAAMVGSLGKEPAASIGLVASTTWLFDGVLSAAASGFAVQVAHLIGANAPERARAVVRQAIVVCLCFGLMMAAVGCAISGSLPHWLGGNTAINSDATRYFLIFSLCLPFLEMSFLGGAMLRCSGNMKVPGLLNVLMCVLDVVFNFFLIFPARAVNVAGTSLHLPGAGLGVTGAALGTALAEAVTCLLMLYFMWFRSRELQLRGSTGSFRPTMECVRKAANIGLPIGVQHIMMCLAYIVTTIIVAPLGNVAIAANAFAITAESLCYMPGYGIGEAATTLVGQSLGAGRRDMMRRFAYITVGSGMALMTVMGLLLYLGAPWVMRMMTTDAEVISLGASVLRIEAWAEPLFAASIVCYGVMVGAGDTKIPSAMNLCSMWLIRLTLAFLLAASMGLRGVWLAMCIELCVRGTIFLIRLFSGRWSRHSATPNPQLST